LDYTGQLGEGGNGSSPIGYNQIFLHGGPNVVAGIHMKLSDRYGFHVHIATHIRDAVKHRVEPGMARLLHGPFLTTDCLRFEIISPPIC